MPTNIEKTNRRQGDEARCITICRHMSLHGTELSVIGAIDYGNNSSPRRRWPQFTIIGKVDVAVHTVLSFHDTVKQSEPWGLRPLRRYQRQMDFVDLTKLAVSATTKVLHKG